MHTPLQNATNPHQHVQAGPDAEGPESGGLSMSPPAFSLQASASATPPVQAKTAQLGGGKGDFDFESASNEERASHLASYALSDVAYVRSKLTSVQSTSWTSASDSDDVAHLLVQKLRRNGTIALISDDLKTLLRTHMNDGWVDEAHETSMEELDKNHFATYLPKLLVQVGINCQDAYADKLLQKAYVVKNPKDGQSYVNTPALVSHLELIEQHKAIFEQKLKKKIDLTQLQQYLLTRVQNLGLPSYDKTSKNHQGDAANDTVVGLAAGTSAKEMEETPTPRLRMWTDFLSEDKKDEKQKRRVTEEIRERDVQGQLKHQVYVSGGKVVLKVGAECKEYPLAEMRQNLADNFNWNAVVSIMKHISATYLDFPYKQPTDLSGNKADYPTIMPGAGLKYIIKAQLEYQIKKYGDKAKDNLPAILKGITPDVDEPFVKNVMGLKSKLDVVSAQPDSKAAKTKMPDFKTADEATLYKSLRKLVLERNGLWSDKDKVTNIVSVRRQASGSNKYNDIMFVAWKEDKDLHVSKYDGTTEPGNPSHGMLGEQTTTMYPGMHVSGSGYTDPGGRTKSIYAKKRNASDYKFTKGDESNRGMNFHRGNVEGTERIPSGKYNKKGGSMAKSKGAELSKDEFAAHHTLTEALYILTQYEHKTLSGYQYLKQLAHKIEKGKVEDEGTGASATKVYKTKQGDQKIEKKYSDYTAFIDSFYSKSANKPKAVDILVWYKKKNGDSSPSLKADLEAKSLADLRTDLKTQAVWKAVIEEQMVDEYNKDKVDASPGGDFATRINRSTKDKKDAHTAYDAKHQKAVKDLAYVDKQFKDFETHEQLKGTEKEKADGTKYIDNPLVTKLKATQYDDKTDFTGDGVGSWSEGCQVVGSNKDFYSYWHDTTKDTGETGQRHWYYTIVDLNTLKTTTSSGTVK